MRLTGFEVSVGAGSLSVVGGEAALLATGASTMGASAVWLSVEVMAMALVGCAGSGGVRRGYFPLGSRPLDFFFALDFFTDTNTLVTRPSMQRAGRPRKARRP